MSPGSVGVPQPVLPGDGGKVQTYRRLYSKEARLGLQNLLHTLAALGEQRIHRRPGQTGLEENCLIVLFTQGILLQDGGEVCLRIVREKVGGPVGPEGLEKGVQTKEYNYDGHGNCRPQPSAALFPG